MYKKAWAIHPHLGKGIAKLLSEEGDMYKERGERDRAEQMYTKAFGIFEKIGLQEEIASLCSNLGHIYEERGELDRGRRC